MRRARRALAAAIGSATGVAGSGAYAYWSAERTIAGGTTFTAGQLDIGAAWVVQITATDLIPGESVAQQTTVSNAGNVRLRYSTSLATSGALAPSLAVSSVVGGTASNSGTQAAGTRSGTCSASAAIPVLAPAQTQQVCVRVQLSPGAASTLQGQSGMATITFTATNPAAP